VSRRGGAVRDAAPIIVSADDAAKGASAGHRLRVLAELHATPADEPELDSPPLATLNDLARFFQHDRRSE